MNITSNRLLRLVVVDNGKKTTSGAVNSSTKMVNTHLCGDSCFSARNSDKTTVCCFVCEKRFNAKCFELAGQQTFKIITSKTNAIFLCSKCIDRVNKMKQNTRKSNDVTTARTTISCDDQSSAIDKTSIANVMSLLSNMDEKFSIMQDSNYEIKQILNDNTRATDANNTSNMKSMIELINQSLINLHAKTDHNMNERTTNEAKMHSLILDRLSELHDKACHPSNKATKFTQKTSGLELSSTSKRHMNRTILTTDPLNWSFSFNQSLMPNENCEIYQLLHGFERNTWTSFDHLSSKLSENTDAIQHIESIVKELTTKVNNQHLSSPTMEAITMDNLQSINDKCEAIKNMIECDSNAKQNEIFLEDNNTTQQLRDQFLKIIDVDLSDNSPLTKNDQVRKQKSSDKMVSTDCSSNKPLNPTTATENELINLKSSIASVNLSMLSINKKNDTAKEPQTYAQKVKVNNNNVAILTLKPKSAQNSDRTDSEFKRMIDPTKVKVNSLKKLPNGCLAIECTDVIESERVKKLICERMSDKYEVLTPELKRPRIKILNVTDELSNVELIDTLKAQNEFLENGELTVINFFQNRNKTYTAIVELDPISFESCMRIKKIKILWTICNVVEDLNIFRCYKCNGYNHKQKNCTNALTCKRCGDNHNFAQCTSETENCVNCKTANEKYNLRMNVNHAVTSEKCAVYKKRMEAERRKIKYSR